KKGKSRARDRACRAQATASLGGHTYFDRSRPALVGNIWPPGESSLRLVPIRNSGGLLGPGGHRTIVDGALRILATVPAGLCARDLDRRAARIVDWRLSRPGRRPWHLPYRRLRHVARFAPA